jgi:penicillin-binding protein 2
MFNYRMKILVAAFALLGGALVFRLWTLQIEDCGQYRTTALAPERLAYRPIPATRGRVLARGGGGRGTVELIGNEPCFEVAVFYPVMDPDEWWMTAQHRQIHRQMKEEARNPNLAVPKEELAFRLQKQMTDFWAMLARNTGIAAEDLLDRRDRIVQSIQQRIVRIRQRQEEEVSYLIREQRLYYPVITDLTETQALDLRGKIAGTGWAVVRPSVRRVYRRKDALCHLMGYTTRIPGSPEETRTKVNDDYLPGELQGRRGLERVYDPELRGSRGWLKLDKQPTIETAPVDGKDITLTIDIELQEYLQKRLIDRMKDPEKKLPYALGAAAVVIDVPNAELLAAVSVPTFDPAEFQSRYRELECDYLHEPLRNRALHRYPPGSIIKPLVGAWALEKKVVWTTTHMECRGVLAPTLRTFKCWLPPPGHGSLNIVGALTHSCDIYFYRVGELLKADGLTDLYRTFGFDRPVPIAIRNGRGLVPDQGWFISRHGRGISIGDARNLAIGQGDLEITPLQAAVMTGALIKGRYQPPKILADEPVPPARSIGISPAFLRAVREGMFHSANDPKGAAHFAFSPKVVLAAKTGSAQTEPKPVAWEMSYKDPGTGTTVKRIVRNKEEFYRKAPVPKRDIGRRTVESVPVLRPEDARDSEGREKHLAHAWIIGYAPADHPRIAAAVFIEYGIAGGNAAGPVLKDLVEKCRELGYFGK